MLDTQMLIGSNFVAGADAPEKVINPKTEETIVKPRRCLSGSGGCSRRCRRRTHSRCWSRTTPAERSALLLKLADAIDREAEAFATLEALNCGKPSIRVLQDEMPAIVRLLPLLRRRRAQHAWRGGRANTWPATPR